MTYRLGFITVACLLPLQVVAVGAPPATAEPPEAHEAGAEEPNWFQKLVDGDRKKQKILYLSRGMRPTDSDVDKSKVTGIHFLPDVTDADLAQLPGYPSLSYLVIGEARIGKAGFKHFSALGSMEVLRLDHLKTTDDPVEHVAGLKKLREVMLVDCPITDKSLVTLAKFKGLEHLDLSMTKITDKGIAELQPLSKLRRLELAWTSVTDSGLELLATNHPLLEELGLTRTKISEKGLQHLRRLVHLKSLALRRTDLSDEAVRELRKALPNTRIYN